VLTAQVVIEVGDVGPVFHVGEDSADLLHRGVGELVVLDLDRLETLGTDVRPVDRLIVVDEDRDASSERSDEGVPEPSRSG
jgi:hypothetical protein